jgi:hypothetical protein
MGDGNLLEVFDESGGHYDDRNWRRLRRLYGGEG